MAVTAPQILTKARRQLKDVDATNYTESELLDYLNEGLRILRLRVLGIWPDYYYRSGLAYQHTANIVNGTANYDLPAGFLAPILVRVQDSDSDWTRLKPLSDVRRLDSDAEGYRLRDNDIYIYPEPDADVTDGLEINYIRRPQTVLKLSVAAVSTGNNEFEVAGDYSSRWASGDTFKVIGSTGNDGSYTLSSGPTFSYSTEQTTLAVSSVSDATVDGSVVTDEYYDVPLADDFQDAYVEFETIKAKARQEEGSEAFVSFYQMIQTLLDGLMVNTNMSEDAGMTMLWRKFI